LFGHKLSSFGSDLPRHTGFIRLYEPESLYVFERKAIIYCLGKTLHAETCFCFTVINPLRPIKLEDQLGEVGRPA